MCGILCQLWQALDGIFLPCLLLFSFCKQGGWRGNLHFPSSCAARGGRKMPLTYWLAKRALSATAHRIHALNMRQRYALCQEESDFRRVEGATCETQNFGKRYSWIRSGRKLVALFMCYKDPFILLHEFSGRKHMRVYNKMLTCQNTAVKNPLTSCILGCRARLI